jgi:hypothetical protein
MIGTHVADKDKNVCELEVAEVCETGSEWWLVAMVN